MSARERLMDALERHGCRPTASGAARCPAHDDRAPSLSFRDATDVAGVVVKCHAGCEPLAIVAPLGLTLADLFDERREAAPFAEPRRVVAEYAYTDEYGEVLYIAVRYAPKDFRAKRPDGRGGYVWNLGDVPRVVYRLPEVLAAVEAGELVYIVEGEKDADALAALGVTATCNVGGAGKWRPAYAPALAGAEVVVIADRDDVGRAHARQVADSLTGNAASVTMRQAAQGKDVSDHLHAGRTLGELLPLEEPAPPTAPTNPTEAAQGGEVQPGESWGPVDLSDVLQGLLDGTLERLTPTVGLREGGGALFYVGKVNGVAGASGSGKTWTALAACCQEIAAGRQVVYVDLEDDAAGVVGRLLELGTDPDDVLSRFHYVRPEEAHRGAAQQRLAALVTDVDPSLVVIDSTGESLALDGMKPNDDDDVARWFRSLPAPLARMGPAVVVLDHVVKADDGGLWPIGSQRKRAAISGAQYMQVVVKSFARGQRGAAKLLCAKDRHGTYRQGEQVAELLVEPDGDRLTLALRAQEQSGAGAPAAFRPTALMERISRFLESAEEPCSRSSLTDRVQGKRTALLDALDVLKAEDYVDVTIGARKAELAVSRKPYRQDADPLSDQYLGSRERVEQDDPAPQTLGRVPTRSFRKEKERGTGETRFCDPSPGTAEERVGNGSPDMQQTCSDCGQELLLSRPGRDQCQRCRPSDLAAS